jgi:hypothetical protein
VADVTTIGNRETADGGTETKTKKKSGLSKTAQGAFTSGVGSAVAGAVIGKNAL